MSKSEDYRLAVQRERVSNIYQRKYEALSVQYTEDMAEMQAKIDALMLEYCPDEMVEV